MRGKENAACGKTESIDCKPVTAAPASADQLSKRIDMHVHMVGNGSDKSGGWLRFSGWHRWLAAFMLKQLGLPASALSGDLELLYSKHLLQLVRGSSLDAVVLLAHE